MTASQLRIALKSLITANLCYFEHGVFIFLGAYKIKYKCEPSTSLKEMLDFFMSEIEAIYGDDRRSESDDQVQNIDG